jgi:hypothetical protein
MNLDASTVMQNVCSLVDEYRQRCLWFLRDNYYPATATDALRMLQYIERHGDVAALRKVAPLKQWLLQHSNEESAA